MENHVQPSDLETDSFSTSHSDGSEPVGKAQVGTFIDSRQSLSSGCCGAREDAQAGAAPACPLPSCTVFDAVSASLVRTLEVEPTDPSCSVEMMCEWCSSFGTVHCITQSLNSRLPRVTVTYIDSRDCQRAKHEFAKLYPAVAIECSSDEAEHDLTGALPDHKTCLLARSSHRCGFSRTVSLLALWIFHPHSTSITIGLFRFVLFVACERFDARFCSGC